MVELSASGWLREMRASRLAPELLHDTPSREFHSILHLFEQALFRRRHGDSINAPSAGGIHPYEAVVFSWEGSEKESLRLVARRINLHRRSYRILPVCEEELKPYFPLLEPGVEGARSTYVLLLSRPWLSMRKYGKRGYLYTQLDVGHAATALLGSAQELGAARLSLHLPRSELRKVLADFIPLREMHSVLSVCLPRKCRSEDQWSFEEESTILSDALGGNELESYSWDLISQYLLPEEETDPMKLEDEPKLALDGEVADRCPPLRDWRKLSSARRSCTGFSHDPLPREKIESLLSVLSLKTKSDTREESHLELGIAVVMSPDIQPDPQSMRIPDEVDITVKSEFLLDENAVTRACNGQSHLGGARLFLLFYADRVGGRPLTWQGIRDCVYQSSAKAHFVYLQAAREGVGITSVGGYDEDSWRAVAGLPTGVDVIYILALGVESAAVKEKMDRRVNAYAHGE